MIAAVVLRAMVWRRPARSPWAMCAGLVGDDADELVWRFGGDDRAGVDEHPLRVDDEGIEALVDDEEDLHVAGLDAGLLEDRRGVVLEQRLGLGVAGDVDAGGGRRFRGEGGGKQSCRKRTADAISGRCAGLSKPRRAC